MELVFLLSLTTIRINTNTSKLDETTRRTYKENNRLQEALSMHNQEATDLKKVRGGLLG